MLGREPQRRAAGLVHQAPANPRLSSVLSARRNRAYSTSGFNASVLEACPDNTGRISGEALPLFPAPLQFRCICAPFRGGSVPQGGAGTTRCGAGAQLRFRSR